MDKVIQFVPSLWDGGGETLVRNYALALKKTSMVPIIVVLHDVHDSANKKTIQKNGIQTYVIYKKWNFITRAVNKLVGPLIVSRRLKEILRREKPCAIHVHEALLKHVAPNINYLKDHGIRIIYTCHSMPQVYFTGKNKNEYQSAKKMIQTYQIQFIALHADMQAQLNQMFGINNTIVLQNGIDVKKFSQVSESKESIRESLGLAAEDFVIGHVGRFSDVKNHKFIITVFHEILTDHPQAKLVLVGEGELEAVVHQQAKDLGVYDNIIFLKKRTDMNRILKALDVLLFPSKYEGLPLTLVEAQASGLKCVISDNINPEVILSERCVVLSLEQKTEEWKKAVLEQSYACVHQVGTVSDYDIDIIVDKLMEMYRK